MFGQYDGIGIFGLTDGPTMPAVCLSATSAGACGASGGAASGIWVIQGCRLIISCWTMAHFRSLGRQPHAADARRHNGMVPGTSTGEGSWTSSGLDFLISVDRRGRGLGAALQQAVRDAIRAGRLHPGGPPPSPRAPAR